MCVSMSAAASRFIWGTAYNLLTAAGNTLSVTASISTDGNRTLSPESRRIIDERQHLARPFSKDERQIIYHDDAMRITRSEIKDLQMLYNYPIHDNHKNVRVGSIIDGFLTDDSTIKILGEITDPAAIAKIDSGEYKGLSVGYTRTTNADNEVVGPIQFREVSICPEPFFPGCNIAISASDETPTSLENKEVKTIVYNQTSGKDFYYSPPQNSIASHSSYMASTSQPGAASTPTIDPIPAVDGHNSSPAAGGTAALQPAAAPASSQPANVPVAETPQDLRELSEKYKLMQEKFNRVTQDFQTRQRPVMEKTMGTLARVMGINPTSIDPNIPKTLPPMVQQFITDQFANMDQPELANFLSQLSNKFEEGSLRYADEQARSQSYQGQVDQLQRQLAETQANLQAVMAQQQQQARQQPPAAAFANTAQPSSALSDIFQRMPASPVDRLYGNAATLAPAKRSFESAFTSPSSLGSMLMQQQPKEVPIHASAAEVDTPEFSSHKKPRVGILPSHEHIFNAISGIKQNVSMRDPLKYSPSEFKR